MTNRGKSDKVNSMASASGLYFFLRFARLRNTDSMHTQWMRGVHVAVRVQPVSTTIQQVGKIDGIHSIRPSIPSSWTDGILIDSPYPTVSQMQSLLWSCQWLSKSLMRSLCCLEQMLCVTQVAHSTMSRPSLSLTD